MRRRLTSLTKGVLLLVILPLLIRCAGTRPAVSSVQVLEFYPAEARPGECIEIRGRGFSPIVTHNEVYFGEQAGTVEWVRRYADTATGVLFVTIPDSATDSRITVRVNGGEPAESDSIFAVRSW